MIDALKIRTLLLNSSFKHVLGSNGNLQRYELGSSRLSVLKNEVVAFQLLIISRERIFSTLGRYNDIHWKGLGPRLRISLELYGDDGSDISDKVEHEMNYEGYVTDDDGMKKADPLLRSKSCYIDKGEQTVWVECTVPPEFKGKSFTLRLNRYFTCNYQAEELSGFDEIHVDVIDYAIKGPVESGFYLDLWQHPASIARGYDVELYSDDHFQIMENYIGDMARYGQRVTTLTLSDYPWAGQRCHQFEDNASNLFEFNIVSIKRDEAGRLKCDFSAMDRYIEICEKHGICDEINLIGIIANWDKRIFGTPIVDYKDPIRLVIFDEATVSFDFVRLKSEFIEYLKQVFDHLKILGVWHKVKVLCDEPNDALLFDEAVRNMENAASGSKISLKCAIHDQNFFEKYKKRINSLSLNTCEVINNVMSLDAIRDKIKEKSGSMTWFSCCFPENLNIFISSPLIESRLIGWFTYYWNFDGFLRWAYANWTGDPFGDIRYKYPRWRAGDMFLVYPGKDLKPISTIRIKNILFGIQDFEIFKDIEKTGISHGELKTAIANILGDEKDMSSDDEKNLNMSYSFDYNKYLNLRNGLIKTYLIKSGEYEDE